MVHASWPSDAALGVLFLCRGFQGWLCTSSCATFFLVLRFVLSVSRSSPTLGVWMVPHYTTSRIRLGLHFCTRQVVFLRLISFLFHSCMTSSVLSAMYSDLRTYCRVVRVQQNLASWGYYLRVWGTADVLNFRSIFPEIFPMRATSSPFLSVVLQSAALCLRILVIPASRSHLHHTCINY